MIKTLLRTLNLPDVFQKPSDVYRGFKPRIPQQIDEQKFLLQIGSVFALDERQVKELWHSYQSFHISQKYATRFGERKTLCFEEAFVLYVILSLFHPPTIIEIGTQFGKSTRRLLDMKNFIGLDTEVICFDIIDQVKHFSLTEAKLVLKDITWSVQQDVLNAYKPGVIYLDAHPYYLLQNVIENVLKNSDWFLTVHDCGKGLCNPRMQLDKNDLGITSETGHWERHVLAEALKVGNPLSDKLDHMHTFTHRVQVFETPHGLATLLPLQKLQEVYPN